MVHVIVSEQQPSSNVAKLVTVLCTPDDGAVDTRNI
jgi:hypothetical protein